MKRLFQSGFVIFVARLTAFSEGKPEAILAAAKKLSENQPWQIEAHVVAKDIDMKIVGVISGKDFDLTIETDDKVRRQIVIGDKGWLSESFTAPAFFSYKSQYWLAFDGQGEPLYIARYEGVISHLSFNKVTATVTKNTDTRCEFEYKLAKDKTIAPPEGAEPGRKH
jgi:hypothetical protein